MGRAHSVSQAWGAEGSHEISDPIGGDSFILTPIRQELLPHAASSTPAASWLDPWCQEPRGIDRDLAKFLVSGWHPVSIVCSISQGHQTHTLLLPRSSSGRGPLQGRFLNEKQGKVKET